MPPPKGEFRNTGYLAKYQRDTGYLPEKLMGYFGQVKRDAGYLGHKLTGYGILQYLLLPPFVRVIHTAQ